ncbi:T9SS type B sorting domain-containing protein [Flavobacterium sp. MK4S-17]|uniref:T9SS type B sorting domain-containing protein n=1 Tax=Flavobacterium sp. MK4S-17 TaxID=2543737 RepID=UPI0013598D04|nr:T9SS type B sorting domain-containing protein [Flavobacterium sp. MK4S-17]
MPKNFLLFLLLICSLKITAQSDCRDAITVCGNMAYEGLNAVGFGTQELQNTNDCQSQENNSLWLKISIKTGGTLGFTLKPKNTDINVDFDFFIYGPNVTCGSIGRAIRCSTTNPAASGAANNWTGMNGTETDVSEGPGAFGNNYIQWLNVLDNETYFLVIDRPIGGSNFVLEWTGTAVFQDAPLFNIPNIEALSQSTCDDDAVDDGKVEFNLTTDEARILQGQPNVVATYHDFQNDALTGINPITNPAAYINTSQRQNLFMRLTNTLTGCFSIAPFSIEVVNPVTAGQPQDLELCDLYENGTRLFDIASNDDAVRNGMPNTQVTYYASVTDARNKTNPLSSPYRNTSPQQTIWARLENISGCYGHDIKTFTLNIIPLPDIDFDLRIKDFTDNNNSISVEMPDPENYQFSLDGNIYTDTSFFGNLEPGPYTVYIKAKTGCKTVSRDAVILNYPTFFTPNGDGANDYWTIPYLRLKPDARVTIFDRYGKVLYGFKGRDKGWDGNFNGASLPATDYWFTLQLENGRIIKGHFAMIR